MLAERERAVNWWQSVTPRHTNGGKPGDMMQGRSVEETQVQQ
jgi:hypothetical protein